MQLLSQITAWSRAQCSISVYLIQEKKKKEYIIYVRDFKTALFYEVIIEMRFSKA